MRRFHLNNSWWLAFVLGAVSVAISAFVLTSLIIIFWSTIFPEYNRFKFEKSIDPFELQGKDFTPIVFGNGRYQGNSAVILELSSGEAILTSKTNFSANKFPFVEWKTSGLNPGLQVLLLWRIQEDPTELHNAKLHFSTDGNNIFDLAKHSEWRGEITQLSLGIFGDLRNKPFILESLELNPFSLNLALKIIPAQWISSNTWKGSSINYSTGTISGKHLPPGLFFGLLFSLSLIFVEILKKFLANFEKMTSMPPRALTYITVIVFCCAGQDFPRFIGRFEQAMETDRVFAGKTLAERAAAAPLRCLVMDRYMHKGYERVGVGVGCEECYAKNYTTKCNATHDGCYVRVGFNCGKDAPLPNF